MTTAATSQVWSSPSSPRPRSSPAPTNRPAAPSTPSAVPSNATPEGSGGLTAQAVEGTYTLNLANTTGQIVSSLPDSRNRRTLRTASLGASQWSRRSSAKGRSDFSSVPEREDQDSRSGGRARNATAE